MGENDYAFFEHIGKYQVPLMFQLAYPNVTLPKLNEILLSEVESIARENNINTLYVRPLKKQEALLTKYYGFEYIDKENVPIVWKSNYYYGSSLIGAPFLKKELF